MLRLDVQPGGEKFLGFAQKKLRDLKSWMKLVGVPAASKHFWFLGNKIWIRSRDIGNGIALDWIRIEAGGIGSVLLQSAPNVYVTIDWDGTLQSTHDFTGKPYAGFRVITTAGSKAVLTDFSDYYVVDFMKNTASDAIAGSTINPTQPVVILGPNDNSAFNFIGHFQNYFPQTVGILDAELAVLTLGATLDMLNTGNENFKHFNSRGQVGFVDVGDDTGVGFDPFFYAFNTAIGGSPTSFVVYTSNLRTHTNSGGGLAEQPGIAVNSTLLIRPVVDPINAFAQIEITNYLGSQLALLTILSEANFIWCGVVCDEENLLAAVHNSSTGKYAVKHYDLRTNPDTGLMNLTETDASSAFNAGTGFAPTALGNSRFSVIQQ